MPLIAPKHFSEYTTEEYHTYVQSMYALRIKRGSTKPKGPVLGLSLSITKKGKVSIRKSKARTFEYVTHSEVAALAASLVQPIAVVWNAFKDKQYVIAKDRMEAECIYAKLKEIPWQ